MNLQPKDIEVSLVQADHEQNLGQWSMQTYSGVVLYHKPTSIQVKCTKHKSQHKNKAEAVRMLDEKVGKVFTDSDKINAIKLVLESAKENNNESDGLYFLQVIRNIVEAEGEYLQNS